MAIVSNPLIGRTKQSAGNMTFTKWKDRNVLKNKATQVANPKSARQQQQRNRFTLLVSAYPYVALIIQAGFKQVTQSMTVFNRWVSENLKAGAVTASNTAPYTASIVAENVIISKGTLLNTEVSTASFDVSAQEITITWPTSVNYNQASTDRLAVMVVNGTKQLLEANADAAPRSAGTVTLPFNNVDVILTDTVRVLTYFYNSNGEASDSDNFNSSVVA